MPRHSKHSICIHERVLRPEGGVETILLGERYAPYDMQRARIENLCGSFAQYVHSSSLRWVVRRTNGQRELYHLHGNATISHGRGSFLAVQGYRGLESLSKALGLTSLRNTVHMVVLTTKIGKRAQVSSGGLLEASLQRQTPAVRVMGRIFEHTNSVGFTINRWGLAWCPEFPAAADDFLGARFEALPFSLPPAFRPDSNDWTVTGKGMVIIRMVWRGLEWTREVEEACTGLCNRVTDWLRDCC